MKTKNNSQAIKICMAGTWLSSSNVGDNAILCGIIDSLSSYKKINLTVFTSNPSRVRSIYRINACAPKKQPIKLLTSLKHADLFLFTGGTPFYDNATHMLYFAFLAICCRLFHVPVLIFGISLRPIRSKISGFLLSIIISNCAYLSFREFDSLNRFEKYFPKKNKANILPDPATQISSHSKIKAYLPIDDDKKYVCICPRDFMAKKNFMNQHYSKTYSQKDLRNYHNVLREITSWLIEQKNYHIVFLPMHIHHPDDDRETAEKVYKSINEPHKTKIIMIKEQYDPLIVKNMFSKMSFVIGIRFHSIVLASSISTPVISIGYDKKNTAIMQFLRQDRFINSIETLDANNIKKQISFLENNRDEIMEGLKGRYNEIHSTYKAELSNIFTLIQNEKSK